MKEAKEVVRVRWSKMAANAMRWQSHLRSASASFGPAASSPPPLPAVLLQTNTAHTEAVLSFYQTSGIGGSSRLVPFSSKRKVISPLRSIH